MRSLVRKYIRRYLNYLYDSVTSGYTEKLLALLEKNPDAVLVDAGCWDGSNTVRWANAVGTAKMVGLEVARSAAKKAREKGVKVLISDLNRAIPLKDSVADVVVANHVIEHLFKVDVFVKELYRILKPGGYAVIGTPNLSSWHNVFALLIGRQPFSGPNVNVVPQHDLASEMKTEKSTLLLSEVENKAEGESALRHIVVMTYQTLLKLLRSNGLVIELTCCFGYHPFPPLIADLLARLDKGHSHYVLVKVRKPRSSKRL